MIDTITIEVRDVYGVTKYYPVCPTAKLFAKIANTTTLTDNTYKCVTDLGYKVIVTHKGMNK